MTQTSKSSLTLAGKTIIPQASIVRVGLSFIISTTSRVSSLITASIMLKWEYDEALTKSNLFAHQSSLGCFQDPPCFFWGRRTPKTEINTLTVFALSKTTTPAVSYLPQAINL